MMIIMTYNVMCGLPSFIDHVLCYPFYILLTDLISISYIILKKLMVFVEDQNKYITDLFESNIEHEIAKMVILYFTFLFSLFVFVSAAGQYNVIWTGNGLPRFRVFISGDNWACFWTRSII